MILDTNALSALADSNDSLIERIHFAPIIYVPLISLGEYHYGISQSLNREELSGWLAAFLLKAQVLAPTLQTIPYYSAIRRELKSAGTPMPANDCWTSNRRG